MNTSSSFEGGYQVTPFGPDLGQFWPADSLQRVVDLGCGDGRNTRWLRDQAAEVWGIDRDGACVDRARALAGDSVHFVHQSAEAFLTTSPLQFDGAVCSCMLGFVADVGNLFRRLRPHLSGRLLVSDWHPLACWLGADGQVGWPYLQEGPCVPGEYHHTIATVTNALIGSGFDIRQVVEWPPRWTDPTYAGAPATVQQLPLAFIWDCHTARNQIEVPHAP